MKWRVKLSEIEKDRWYNCFWLGEKDKCCIRTERVNKEGAKNKPVILYSVRSWWSDSIITSGSLKHCKEIVYQILDVEYYDIGDDIND